MGQPTSPTMVGTQKQHRVAMSQSKTRPRSTVHGVTERGNSITNSNRSMLAIRPSNSSRSITNDIPDIFQMTSLRGRFGANSVPQVTAISMSRRRDGGPKRTSDMLGTRCTSGTTSVLLLCVSMPMVHSLMSPSQSRRLSNKLATQSASRRPRLQFRRTPGRAICLCQSGCSRLQPVHPLRVGG